MIILFPGNVVVGQSVAAAAAAAAVAAAAQAAGGGQAVPTSQADSMVGAGASQQVTTNSVTPKVLTFLESPCGMQDEGFFCLIVYYLITVLDTF